MKSPGKALLKNEISQGRDTEGREGKDWEEKVARRLGRTNVKAGLHICF